MSITGKQFIEQGIVPDSVTKTTLHIVWFDSSNKIYSTGRDYTGTNEIDCIEKWKSEFPDALFHSASIK